MFKFTDLLNFLMGPRLYVGGGGGGQQAPTQTTVNNTSIPDYARPYVETMLGTTQQQLYNYETDPTTGQKFATSMKGYTPFSEDPSKYVAGFSPMQEQSLHLGHQQNIQVERHQKLEKRLGSFMNSVVLRKAAQHASDLVVVSIRELARIEGKLG